ncbi:BglG family transcription antiterminator [Salipaludibacillus aurantiacus]|uniref:Transcriptional antiterminator n=1 Tax=Salipaludibacillus aurantiacus TaxID=1601833 RepID=A0A1H9UCD7_9BACI|nr:PTS sugar transporter subunit IIA [Salipaludibacillus aurantiacus]SES06743.1 Transcriptional antiterminator [Salipaludibacillus aurantiacus]
MNARRRQLVQMILNGNTQFKIKDVEDMFGVSERTLRYDLEIISGWLKEQSVDLDHVSGRGVWELKSSPDNAQLKKIYEALNFYGRSISVEERFLLIIHELIIQEDWQSLRQIAEELDVSKATILQQMEKVEQWAGQFHLLLERGSKGFRLKGEERHKRLALLSVIEKLEEAWDTVNPIPNLNWSHFSLNDIDKSFSVLEESLHRRGNLSSCFRVWTLQLQRVRSGHFLKEEKRKGVTVENWFSELWRDLCAAFEIHFLEDEMIFAYLYLRATGGIYDTDQILWQKNELFLTFADKMSTRMGLAEFSGDQLDEIYREWESFLIAKEHEIIFIHPLKKKVEEQYPFIIFHLWEVLSDEIMPEETLRMDSMTPMAICLAFIYEKASFENERYPVWVVCPGGLAASRLLTVTIMKHFPQIEVKKTMAISELKHVKDWEKPDFIVSSVSLHDTPYPYVTVKPIMTADDIKKLENFIGNTARKNGAKLIEESHKSIHALIPPERIAVYEETATDNLEPVLDVGVSLLEQANLVNAYFVDDIKRTVFEKEYLYELIPGLLFIHTDSNNVMKPGFSLVQLKKPFVKGDKLHSYAVLFMATPDKQAHIPQLQYLHQLLMNKDRVDEILHWSKLIGRGD